MGEENKVPSELDALFSPGLLEYRLAIQEKRSDQQEVRIRMIETQVVGMAKDMAAVSTDTSEIKKTLEKSADISRQGAEANKRNFVSIIVAGVSVIGTVLLTHFVK